MSYARCHNPECPLGRERVWAVADTGLPADEVGALVVCEALTAHHRRTMYSIEAARRGVLAL